MEQQALANSTTRPATGADQANGISTDESNGDYASQKLALQELNAVADKQKEQLEAVLAQNKSLQAEFTSLQTPQPTTYPDHWNRPLLLTLFIIHSP